MRVAIVHYHLRTGGVTRVIQHATTALKNRDIETVILTGESPPAGIETTLRFRVVENLGYEHAEKSVNHRDLATDLKQAAEEVFGASPDLWHFHNHSLGKNLSLPLSVHHMAQMGQLMLLQIHDFAEDGRPTNYQQLFQHIGHGDLATLSRQLYPLAGHIHYAAINSRDREFLASAGVPRDCLHLLPNAVRIPSSASPTVKQPKAKDERLFLYPTRAIRRKNLGEFLLWAAMGEETDRFATTLAPENPLERRIYDRWVDFAGSLNLPVTFELGADASSSFETMLSSAYAFMTTSIAEGFGLAFLEPWLAGRPVRGRNLPEITADFRSVGLDLTGLYDRLEVPVAWIGEHVLEAKIKTALDHYLSAYGRKPEAEEFERARSAFIVDRQVDFGRLDEASQERLIHKIVESPVAREQLSPSTLSTVKLSPDRIERNRQAVLREFSLEGYGERLAKVYSQIMASTTEPLGAISSGALLDRFLKPERLFLLRVQ